MFRLDISTPRLVAERLFTKAHGLKRYVETELLRRALADKRVVITGASSGIGRATALRVAEVGGEAVLLARSRERLEAVRDEIVRAGGRATVHPCDLSSEEQCDAVVAAIVAEGPVDVLINNAGRSIRRALRFSYGRAHDFERTMALNYFGALRLTLGLLPHMRDRKRGHIINVSSAGVLVRAPRFAAYIASKAAFDAFSQVAASELFDDHIRVTTVYMPLVRTPMIAPTAIYRAAPALSPEQAADLTLQALVTKQTYVRPLFAATADSLHRIAPRLTQRALSALYHRTPGQGGHGAVIAESPAASNGELRALGEHGARGEGT